MSINELPEECLLIIFGSINELDDLLNCYKVCSKWSHLIVERTRKVKYLVEHKDYEYNYVADGTRKPNDETFSIKIPSYSFDYVYYRTQEPIDGTCLSTLFPNLMIADFCMKLCEKVEHENIVALIKKIKSFKGIIGRFYNIYKSIFQYCDQLEMVAAIYMEPCIKKIGVNIKQLHLWSYPLNQFKEDAHYFPNLERLHIYNRQIYPDRRYKDTYYNGPILSRLKIVELSLSDYKDKIYDGFHFMDSCQNLQSAHIKLDSDHIFVDGSLKHESLQDLVLQFCPNKVCWNELKELLKKYPNLKHLALRECYSLKNKHVEQLVNILPNLVLFDVRDCLRVTQEAANCIHYYNRLHGRTIKFYFDGNYHDIQSDWPHLSSKPEKISQGFDFLKNCFLKDSNSLPTFLIPSKD